MLKKIRTIFHLDMDSYFASVEQQMDPFLQGQPIVVAGKPGTRTVVAAASKEAKKFGIKSGIPTWEAVKKCSQVLIVPGHPSEYQRVHREIFEFLCSFTPEVEVFSIDEWFLDLTDTQERFGGVIKIVQEIKDFLKGQFGDVLTCSIGVASHRIVAKLASDLKKPDGFVWLKTEQAERELLKGTSLTNICGIGPRLEKRLNRLGIFNVQNLIDCPDEVLIREFGPHSGLFLQGLVNSQVDSGLMAFYEQPEEKSISNSTTLPFNTLDMDYVKSVLLKLCYQISRRLRQRQFYAQGIRIWLRNQDFMHWSNAQHILSSTQSTRTFYRIGLGLLQKIKFTGQIRALGVAAFNLTHNRQLSLFGQEDEPREKILDGVLDQVNVNAQKLFPGIFLKSYLENRIAGYYPRQPRAGIFAF